MADNIWILWMMNAKICFALQQQQTTTTTTATTTE
jgi:hypothetical protein